MDAAKLLTEAINYAIVQLPGRSFPGVVFQGDSLASLISELEEAISSPDERENILEDLAERLNGIRRHYEDTLIKHGIQRPY